MEWNSQFETLVNHNEDIKQLVEKGYAIAFDSGYLVVRDIPYVDHETKLQIGAIVSKLVFIDQFRVQQEDHQIFFAGTHPCQIDGQKIANLGGGDCSLALESEDIAVQRSFSNKPINGYLNFYEKIESYVAIISGPAIELFDVTPLTFRCSTKLADSVFNYFDTLTSRAEIGDLSNLLAEEIIAIIGLGGTGAYILDFIVKTPVKEIRAFDYDRFYVHNAFRSPGRLNSEELGNKKFRVYHDRYDSFRTGLKFEGKYITDQSIEDLEGVTFAFVCVDKGSARNEIFKLLIQKKISFIDVGMGLWRENSKLDGMIRTTFYSEQNAEEIYSMGLAPIADNPDDIYKHTIQISELNALNACHAVIKYKKLRGFYLNSDDKFHSVYSISDSTIVKND